MQRYLMFLAFLAATACSGEAKPVGDDDDDDDVVGDDDDDDDDDDDSGTLETGTTGDEFFTPVAVGFEYTGGVLSDGTLSGFRYPGDPADPYSEYFPYLVMTFASEAYFSASDDDTRAAESCVTVVLIDPPPAITLPAIPMQPFDTGDPLIYSYEFALTVDPANSGCFDEAAEGGKLDPALWGTGGTTDLHAAFDGARFGMGFGPLSQYVLDALGEGTLADKEFMEALFSEYIAINDKDGNWVAVDWTLGILFQWDEATHEAATNADNTLIPQPLGGGFPSGYVQSSAVWYQDFPLLDFTNLKDGAP